MAELTTTDHRRDRAGLTYVYPVVSRRAGGLSVGVNLNPNQACNWRCIYCQVPGLVRGSAPSIDVARLETELRGFLGDVLGGDYLATHVPAAVRRLNQRGQCSDFSNSAFAKRPRASIAIQCPASRATAVHFPGASMRTRLRDRSPKNTVPRSSTTMPELGWPAATDATTATHAR